MPIQTYIAEVSRPPSGTDDNEKTVAKVVFAYTAEDAITQLRLDCYRTWSIRPPTPDEKGVVGKEGVRQGYIIDLSQGIIPTSKVSK